ncbi:hypothetical protein D3C84_1078180 [compost metagenome]
MDADRHLVVKGVADLMNVANLGRNHLDLARTQMDLASFGFQGAVGVALETLGEFRAT